METLLSIFHILVALGLLGIILIQDPKGGGAGMFSSGGGGNSLFGATGAPTFLSKVTKWLGIFFAVSSIALTIITKKPETSVTDRLVPNSAGTQQMVPEAGETDKPTEETAPAPEAETNK